MIAQLAFDLDIEAPAETVFSTMQTAENGGKCSRCLRPLKGRYSLCHGSASRDGYRAWCDDCSEAKQKARAA
jgi:hypothetical protein